MEVARPVEALRILAPLRRRVKPGQAGERGQREEARAMLADIYGWFTEGLDTVELKDAKALHHR
jgi:hypothetical protein